MRNLLFLIMGCSLVFGAMAQPTITNLNNLDIGDKYSAKTMISEINIALITEGVNQTWDFSNVQSTNEAVTAICVEPANTPFADSAEVANSNIAIRSFGDTAIDTLSYQFLKVANDQCEMIALGFSAPLVNLNYSKWLDPMIVLKFPFTYGDSFSDQSVMWMNYISENTYVLKDTSNILVSAVGYGTVKTPVGTFQNALMVKKVTNWTWWNNYDNYVYKTEGTDIEYQWFVPGIKLSVLSIIIMDDFAVGTYISHTEMAEGGLGDGEGGGDGGGGDGGGDGDPYNTAGVWLNTMGAAGDSYTKSVGSLSWTMGEAVIETLNTSSNIFTQGFCQPEELVTSIIEHDIESEIKVYPNPFVSEITISISDFKQAVNAAIYSTSGQIMKTFTIDGPVTHLQLNELKSGVYFIRMITEDGLRSFVVLKK